VIFLQHCRSFNVSRKIATSYFICEVSCDAMTFQLIAGVDAELTTTHEYTSYSLRRINISDRIDVTGVAVCQRDQMT